LNIRKYKEADEQLLIKLWEEVFPESSPHNEPSKMLREKLAVDDLIFVVEEGQKLVGACIAGYDGHRGWLYAVAVAESKRRGGTGSELIKYTMDALKKVGCEKVNLQIRSTNTKVKAFYESLGFITEDRLSMGRIV
jgi:ribosomal protein S18 acetylase RimI-like enzyme